MKRALFFICVACFVKTARGDIKNDRFYSDEWAVSIKLPRHWQATERTSYPSILLWLAHPSPRARMLFTAEKIDDTMDSQRYAEHTLKELKELGFATRLPQLHPSTGAFWIDYNNESRYLRTALLVFSGKGYSLTLAADQPKGRSKLLRAFDSTLRSIRPARNQNEKNQTPQTP